MALFGPGGQSLLFDAALMARLARRVAAAAELRVVVRPRCVWRYEYRRHCSGAWMGNAIFSGRAAPKTPNASQASLKRWPEGGVPHGFREQPPPEPCEVRTSLFSRGRATFVEQSHGHPSGLRYEIRRVLR